MPDNPKIKPVKAWGVVWPDGGLHTRTFVGPQSAKYFAISFGGLSKPLKVVRVEIRVLPKRKKVSR